MAENIHAKAAAAAAAERTYATQSAIDAWDSVTASDPRYERLIDLYLRSGGGSYGQSRNEIIAKVEAEVKRTNESTKGLATYKSISKYSVDNVMGQLSAAIAKSSNLATLRQADPQFPKFTAVTFDAFTRHVVRDYGGLIFTGGVVRNDYNTKPRTPEFVAYNPKGGPTNAKWDALVKKGRIPASAAAQTTTAWCDPHCLMAYNTQFVEGILIHAYLTGTTASGSARGKKYVSMGGDIPDYWWPLEFLMLHELLHFRQGDFYLAEKMAAVLDTLRPKTKNFSKTKFGHSVLNILNDCINNWVIAEKTGLPILTDGYLSEELTKPKLMALAAKTGEHWLVVGARIVMEDMIKLNREDPEEFKNQQKKGDQHQQQDGDQQEQPDSSDDSEASDVENSCDDAEKGDGKPSAPKDTKDENGDVQSQSQRDQLNREKKKIDDAVEQDKKDKKQSPPSAGKKDDKQDDKGEPSKDKADDKSAADGEPSKDKPEDSKDAESGNGGSGDTGDGNLDTEDFNPDREPSADKGGGSDESDKQQEETATSALDKALSDAIDKAFNDSENDMEEILGGDVQERDVGAAIEAERKRKEALDKAVANASGKTLGKIALYAEPRMSWDEMIKKFFRMYKLPEETYSKFSAQTLINISSSSGNDDIAIDPGTIKTQQKSRIRVVFVFDTSGSVWNQIGKANSQLWKLVKKFGVQLDECWFLRFSSKNDYDLHFLTDKRRFLGKKLTPSGKTEILRAGKANTGAFTLDDKDVYPRERPFATILMGEEGNDDEKSAIPGAGGTDFDGNILTIMEALYRRGCGVIMFSDSDIARGENLQSAKQMVFDTFGVTPKRPHSIGICMAQQRDFTTMATALGSDGDNIFEMTYFTADAKEHVEFEDIE